MKTGLNLFLIMAFLINLCACTKKLPEMEIKYYPECYQPVKKLSEDERFNPEAKAGTTGALLGALGGAIISGIASGSWRAAGIGAVAGGVAGAVTGSLSAYLNKIDDQEKRLEEYGRHLDKNIKDWNIQRASVERSLQCYMAQTDRLKHEFDSGQMSATAAKNRAEEICAGLRNIKTYWQATTTKMHEAFGEGDKYLEEESMKGSQGKPESASMGPEAQEARQNSNKKRNSVQNSNARTDNMLKDAENAAAGFLREVNDSLRSKAELEDSPVLYG